MPNGNQDNSFGRNPLAADLIMINYFNFEYFYNSQLTSIYS